MKFYRLLLALFLLASTALAGSNNPFVGEGLAVSSVSASYSTLAPVAPAAAVQWPCNPCAVLPPNTTYPWVPECPEGTELHLDDAAICASTFNLHVNFTRGIACAMINQATTDHTAAYAQAQVDFDLAMAEALQSAEDALARIDAWLDNGTIDQDQYDIIFDAIQEEFDADVDAAAAAALADKKQADEALTTALNAACAYLQAALAQDIMDYEACMATACRPVID